jgi:uncharacterized membrane protein YccF (DUF307 family)
MTDMAALRLLGNIIWFLSGGCLIGLVYLLGAIIFFPLFPFLLPLVGFAFWPLGRDVVSREKLDAYKKLNGVEIESTAVKDTVGVLANIIWACTFGIVLATLHLIAAIINFCLFWTIIAIPNIVGNWKLIGVAFAPFNRTIVPSDLAKEINIAAAKARLGFKQA